MAGLELSQSAPILWVMVQAATDLELDCQASGSKTDWLGSNAPE